jgi:hypothetical protein
MANSRRRKVNKEDISILLTSSVDIQEDIISMYLMHAVSDMIVISCSLILTELSSAWATRTLITRKLKGLEDFIG